MVPPVHAKYLFWLRNAAEVVVENAKHLVRQYAIRPQYTTSSRHEWRAQQRAAARKRILSANVSVGHIAKAREVISEPWFPAAMHWMLEADAIAFPPHRTAHTAAFAAGEQVLDVWHRACGPIAVEYAPDRLRASDPTAPYADIAIEVEKALWRWFRCWDAEKLASMSQCIVDEHIAAVARLVNKAERAEEGDDSVYVPAVMLWRERFQSYQAFRRWLDKTPSIRHRRPRKNRLEIHAGDWIAYWHHHDQANFKAIDGASGPGLTEESAEYLLAAHRRYKGLYRRKAHGEK